MPNWCENDLVVKGKKEHLDTFRVAVAVLEGENKTDLSFDKILPMPEELKNTTAPSKNPSEELNKKYGADNWYNWSIINWGSKWNACEVYLEKRARSLLYCFNTAWSPPMPFILKASLLFPELEFALQYFEAGMGFCGMYVCKNGQIINEAYNGDYRGGRGG